MNAERVRYLLVGGHALAFHGLPRFTTSIDGVEFAPAFERRITSTYKEHKLFVICRDDLIANKRASGRPQDLLDVERLLQAEAEDSSND
ncbi:MAG: hypothetical protein GY854_29700 [Deltaproteobacteria bacterium]|nr:hypothetical protein [Deltaproteobacteria bacterium]